MIRDRDLHQVQQPGSLPSGQSRKLVLKINSIAADTLVCTTADGTATVSVYKPMRLIQSLNVSNDKYTFAYTGDQARTSTKISDSSTEDQHVTPRHRVGDFITVEPAPIGLAELLAVSADWIECDTPRAWAIANGGAE